MTKTDTTKKAMLVALERGLGVVTTACKSVGISRETHYKWLKTDEDYKTKVEELANVALDFAETQLHQQIRGGNPTATIFYLKTKGKSRGYVERQEIQHDGGEGLIIEVINAKDKD